MAYEHLPAFPDSDGPLPFMPDPNDYPRGSIERLGVPVRFDGAVHSSGLNLRMPLTRVLRLPPELYGPFRIVMLVVGLGLYLVGLGSLRVAVSNNLTVSVGWFWILLGLLCVAIGIPVAGFALYRSPIPAPEERPDSARRARRLRRLRALRARRPSLAFWAVSVMAVGLWWNLWFTQPVTVTKLDFPYTELGSISHEWWRVLLGLITLIVALVYGALAFIKSGMAWLGRTIGGILAGGLIVHALWPELFDAVVGWSMAFVSGSLGWFISLL